METIGLDLGTGAIKGVRWNSGKGITGRATRSVPLRRPEPGRVELDAEEYLRTILGLLAELATLPGEPLDAIAWDAASGNTVLCDNVGTPLRPAISWLDTRLPGWRPPEEWHVRQVTGWPAITTFPLMHLEYFLRTEPELLASAQVTMLNELLSWRLTGKRGLDRSSATPFYLANQSTGEYHLPYLKHYHLTQEQLPPLMNTGETIGHIKPEFAVGDLTSSTRVVAGCFDHPAGARAANVEKPGNLLLSFGTSWVGFHPVLRREDVPERELCDPFQSSHGGCWGAMFSVSSIGLEIEHFVRERYGDTPERYEHLNSEGLNPTSEASSMMRQVVGRFRDKLGGREFGRVVMIGGPSEGEAWEKHIADGLGIRPERCAYRSYSCAVGAAMIAAGKESHAAE